MYVIWQKINNFYYLLLMEQIAIATLLNRTYEDHLIIVLYHEFHQIKKVNY